MATVRTIPFEIEASDGGPLRGEVRVGAMLSGGGPAVIICHGFKGFKDWGFFPHLANRIARAGIMAVTFNFSGSGVGPDGESFSEPERFGHATYTGDLDDLTRVVTSLMEGGLVAGLTPPGALGLFGHSRGGATAVLYAAKQPPAVRCLVTWAAVANVARWDPATTRRWRTEGVMDIVNARTGDVLPLYTDLLDEIEAHAGDALNLVRAASTLDIPWLILHGEADESVPPAEATMLHEAARTSTVKLQLIPMGTHTFGARHPWGGTTPELDEAMSASVAWYSRHLL